MVNLSYPEVAGHSIGGRRCRRRCERSRTLCQRASIGATTNGTAAPARGIASSSRLELSFGQPFYLTQLGGAGCRIRRPRPRPVRTRWSGMQPVNGPAVRRPARGRAPLAAGPIAGPVPPAGRGRVVPPRGLTRPEARPCMAPADPRCNHRTRARRRRPCRVIACASWGLPSNLGWRRGVGAAIPRAWRCAPGLRRFVAVHPVGGMDLHCHAIA